MSVPAVRVSNLGKQYHLGTAGPSYTTLRDSVRSFAGASLRTLLRRARSGERRPTFWALQDVSFEIQPGEVVGIIGRNGAGKSTLLKILSRITEPTKGEAEIRGRVGSLLEVGTGFHPELTGRENIFLNGAILGMRRNEILKNFDQIVAFAEVEKFIDTPVKHYSSGMYMRLAFAVAAHLETEILIVDEVLAVGDAEFQKKCLGKMGDVAKQGRTVLFVSHNMAAVNRICSRAIVLERGSIVADGAPADATTHYLGSGDASTKFDAKLRNMKPHGVEIIDAWLESNGRRSGTFVYGQSADVLLTIRVSEPIRFSVELILRQHDGIPIAFAPSGLAKNWELNGMPGDALIRCSLPPLELAAGTYSLDLIAAATGSHFLDYVESGLTLEIDSTAIGERNWRFHQARGQGCLVWNVDFEQAAS